MLVGDGHGRARPGEVCVSGAWGRRLCEPEEVAEAVHFLACDRSSFVNGETLVVDNGMAVPEATMHEHDRPVLRENQIRASWKTCRVQTVAESSGMHSAAEGHFRPRVLASDPGHHPGTGLLVDVVRHMAPGARS